jgi:hypothetical protein
MVSLAFLLAIAFPARQIVKQLKLKNEITWIFCALLWSSPLYIFWGRSFMIETTGLFFTISAIPFLLRLQTPRPNYKHASIAGILGSLAMLQKVTTALPALMVFGLFTLYYYLFKTSFRQLFKNQVVCLLIAYLIPLVIMQSWTLFTDSIKIKNEFGKTLTSSALMEWHFGSLEQRLSAVYNYQIFWRRMIHNNIAGFLGILLLSGALVFGRKSIKKAVLFCLVLWVVPVFIFFNLHRVHDYYQTSCLIYLIAALTIAVTGWLPEFARKPFVTPLCIATLLGVNIFQFFSEGFFKSIARQHTPENEISLGLSKIISEFTPENSAIVVFGYDWSSEIAFYSKRKSFTVPDKWCNKTSYWTNVGFTMGDKKVSAVLCAPSDCVKLEQLLQKPEVRSQPQIFSIYDCLLWLPGVASIVNPSTHQKVFPLPADSLTKLAYAHQKF